MELSKVNLKMIIRDKGEIEVNLFKHLSPTAVGNILRNIDQSVAQTGGTGT